MKFLAVVIVSFFIFSCVPLNHRNFNKQKFTNLKSHSQKEEDVVTTKAEPIYEQDSKFDEPENSADNLNTSESEVNSDETYTPSEDYKEFNDNASSNYILLDEEEYTDSTEKILKHALALNYNFLIEINNQWFRIDSAIFVEETKSVEGNLIPVDDINEYRNKRTIHLETNGFVNPINGFVSIHKGQILLLISSPQINPEKIPEDKNFVQDSDTTNIDSKENSRSANARRRYDFLFAIGLALFILAVLAYLMAIFALSTEMLFLSLLAATPCIIAAFAMSIVLVIMSRKVKAPHRTTRFKIENTLAWIVAIIGTLVVLGIIGLIIFLIIGF